MGLVFGGEAKWVFEKIWRIFVGKPNGFCKIFLGLLSYFDLG